ncbi:uncharacterized protein IAS62_005095 [Cryptococcus decagattii]|uniref:Uncharacterized protein n=1 Tax=Cryptococcus decagattii TaxID=1859122 RepID=A0ABZ2AZA4_9TREE
MKRNISSPAMSIRFTRKTILTSDPLHHLLLLFLPSPARFSLIFMLHVSECQNDASQLPKSKITREEIQKKTWVSSRD